MFFVWRSPPQQFNRGLFCIFCPSLCSFPIFHFWLCRDYWPRKNGLSMKILRQLNGAPCGHLGYLCVKPKHINSMSNISLYAEYIEAIFLGCWICLGCWKPQHKSCVDLIPTNDALRLNITHMYLQHSILILFGPTISKRAHHCLCKRCMRNSKLFLGCFFSSSFTKFELNLFSYSHADARKLIDILQAVTRWKFRAVWQTIP